MTDTEFDAALQAYMRRFSDANNRDGAIYIVTPNQVVNGGFVIAEDETIEVTLEDENNQPFQKTLSGFVDEFRTRMDGNQTPREGTVVAVLG